MAFVPPTLNGLRAIGVRLVMPWRGVWIADVELDADVIALAPTSGPAVLVVGGLTMLGSVDPRASGSFVNRAQARIIGGHNGGWDNPVPAQHFTNPSGTLLSTLVYQATAALVGEVVIDTNPILLGTDYVRSGGPASRVLKDEDWFVDPITGTTFVGQWPPLPQDPTATITNFLPDEQRIQMTCDSVVLPGTILIDPRFGTTTYIARDVEQTFSQTGSHVEVWTATQPVSRLQEAFANLVREFAQTAILKNYRYRFVVPVGSNKMALQAITSGAPDLNPISQWSGLAGAQSKITPGTEIIVGFAGDASAPFIMSYSPLSTPPLEIDLAGGANFLTPTPWAVALQLALAAFCTALGSATDSHVVSAASALNTALGLLPPSATILTKAT